MKYKLSSLRERSMLDLNGMMDMNDADSSDSLPSLLRRQQRRDSRKLKEDDGEDYEPQFESDSGSSLERLAREKNRPQGQADRSGQYHELLSKDNDSLDSYGTQ